MVPGIGQINDLYKKIGLDEEGEPFDRPPKLYPPEEEPCLDYGFSDSHSVGFKA